MKNIKIVWALIIANILLIGLGAFGKMNAWEFAQPLLFTGLGLMLITWSLIMIDITKRNMYNKITWIVFMLSFPFVTQVVYLLKRDEPKYVVAQ